MRLFESHETLTPTDPSALLPSPFSLLAPLPIPILAFFSPDNTIRYDRYFAASSATFTSFCFYMSSQGDCVCPFATPGLPDLLWS
jgi:hypothetical protein